MAPTTAERTSPRLVTRHERYKKATNIVVAWLASNGQAAAAAPGRLKGKARKEAKKASLPSTKSLSFVLYTTQDLLRFADQIRTNQTGVPSGILMLLERAIRLRTQHSAGFNSLPDKAQVQASNKSHDYFITVLKQVQACLLPLRLPPSAPSTQEPSTENLVNLFEHLELHETLTEDQIDEAIGVQSSKTAEFTLKDQDTRAEALLALSFLLSEMKDQHDVVKQTWTDVPQGQMGLASASLVTIVAMDTIRFAAEQINELLEKHGGFEALLPSVYQAACQSRNINPDERMESGDKINLDESALSVAQDTFFTPLFLLRQFRESINPSGLTQNDGTALRRHFSIKDFKGNDLTLRQEFDHDSAYVDAMLPDMLLFRQVRLGGGAEHEVDFEDDITKAMCSFIETNGRISALAVFTTACCLQTSRAMRKCEYTGLDPLRNSLKNLDQTLWQGRREAFCRPSEQDLWNDVLKATRVLQGRQAFVDEDILKQTRQSRAEQTSSDVALFTHCHILCGLWVFRLRFEAQKLSLKLINLTGSVISVARLYFALEKRGLISWEQEWHDLQTFLKCTHSASWFLFPENQDGPPDLVYDYKAFFRDAGYSATNFLPGTRNQRTRWLPDKVKQFSFHQPILQIFDDRLAERNARADWSSDPISRLISQIKTGTPVSIKQRKGNSLQATDDKTRPAKELLRELARAINLEIFETHFMLIRLHMTCSKLLMDLMQEYNYTSSEDQGGQTWITEAIVKEQLGEGKDGKSLGDKSPDRLMVGYILDEAAAEERNSGALVSPKRPGLLARASQAFENQLGNQSEAVKEVNKKVWDAICEVEDGPVKRGVTQMFNEGLHSPLRLCSHDMYLHGLEQMVITKAQMGALYARKDHVEDPE